MQNQDKKHHTDNDEISIKELILKTQEYIKVIWSKKIGLIAVSLLFGAGFALKAYLKPTTYTAELTFMVNQDDGGSMGGIGAMLGQFGLGGSGGGASNFDKITEIARSGKICERTLMDSATVGGTKDLLANHIIKAYEMHEGWQEDTVLADFVFTQPFVGTRQYNIALNTLIGFFKGAKKPGIASLEFDEKSTILKISTTAIDQELSAALTNSWYDKIQVYYVLKSTEGPKKTLQELTVKADSIYGLLSGAESGLATGSDKLGLVKTYDRLPTSRSGRNLQMYGAMYAEVIKNKETSDFILKSETPYFQKLDEPRLPINGDNGLGWKLNMILGMIAGGFVFSGFVIGRILWKDLMQGE
jgi:hypothetical protein